MDALIERYNSGIIDSAKLVAFDKSIPVYERIIRVVRALNLSGDSSGEIMEHIHKPQNALMHQKIQRVIYSSLPPILAEIIREGIEKGLFNTPYPQEGMEMMVIYLNTLFDNDIIELTEEERNARIKAFAYNAERLLGAKSGSLVEVMSMFEG